MEMDKGIPLGLLGAENVLGQPLFLISKGYLIAVSYVVSLWRSKQGSFPPHVISVCRYHCIIACWPGSRVLMIPIKDWFLDSAWTVLGPPAPNYPYIMVRLTFEYSNIRIYISGPFNGQVLELAAPSFRDWTAFALPIPVIDSVPQTESTYDCTTGTTSARQHNQYPGSLA